MKFMTIDTEATGKDWTTAILHGIGVAYSEDEAKYYPAWAIPKHVREDLANPKISKVGHNLHGYDAKLLERHGFKVNGEFDDTMVIWNLIDSDMPLGLKYLSDKYIGEESLEKKRFLDQYIGKCQAGHIGGLCAQDLSDPSHPHTKVIADYCIEDCLNTTRLFWKGIEKLKEIDLYVKTMGFKKSPLDYYKEEARPLERVLFEIESRGIRVDLKVLEDIKNNALSRMKEIETRLNKVFCKRIELFEEELYQKEVSKVTRPEAKAKRIKGQGKCKFSWENGNHVGVLLYKFCDVPEDFHYATNKGKLRTDKAAVFELKINVPRLAPYLDLYSEYKKHIKIVSTYTGDNDKGIMSKVRVVDGVHRIFPHYRQTTGTGRLAGSNPNMQNLKNDSEIKRFFIPDTDKEVFDDSDYSQIELCTGAHLSKDPGLVSAYAKQEDVHIRTANRLFKTTLDSRRAKEKGTEDYYLRQAGKETNFLTIFDGGANRLQTSLKAKLGKEYTKEQCQEFIKEWFALYPGVREYLDDQLAFFKSYGFCISETGRIRRLPDIRLGAGIKWVKTGYKDAPRYKGPMKDSLIAGIKTKNPKLPTHRITEDMIGWEAHRRYKHAIKAGYNQPIQGLAASITKRAMIQLHRKGHKIANQVHDSLTTARKAGDFKSRDEVIDIMQNTYRIDVPVVVEMSTLKTFHPKDEVRGL